MSENEIEQYRPEIAELQETADGTILTVGTLDFQCIYTPGHSPGGQCFLHGNHLIAGDTVFIDGCGRCDLPGSDPKAMYHSMHHKVMTLPQKQSNRFMLADSEEAFIRVRMG